MMMMTKPAHYHDIFPLYCFQAFVSFLVFKILYWAGVGYVNHGFCWEYNLFFCLLEFLFSLLLSSHVE